MPRKANAQRQEVHLVFIWTQVVTVFFSTDLGLDLQLFIYVFQLSSSKVTDAEEMKRMGKGSLLQVGKFLDECWGGGGGVSRMERINMFA